MRSVSVPNGARRAVLVLRRTLDLLYGAGGTVAALAIVGILLAILAQLGLRLASVPFDATALSGYLLATATFFGLAYAQRKGAHIRVTMLLNLLPPRIRAVADKLTQLMFLVLALYATWWTADLVWFAWTYMEASEGLMAIPLWIPKLAMTAGLALLSVALIDDLVAGPAAASGTSEEPHD